MALPISRELELRKAAGRLCASLLRFEEAKRFLEPVSARNTTDAEVSYYLGIAYEGLGDRPFARRANPLKLQRDMPAFRGAGGFAFGGTFGPGRKSAAGGVLSAIATQAAPDDPRTAEELSAVLRA